MDFTMFAPRKGLAQVKSPQELLLCFESYLDFMSEGGLWWETIPVKRKEGVEFCQVPKRVPLTTKGFCVHAGISHITFMNYLNPSSGNYDLYHEVAEYIRDICAVNIFNGASIGVFNGNLAAGMIKRDFGLEETEAVERSNVQEIKHEVIFTNYEDVLSTETSPGNVLPEYILNGHIFPNPASSYDKMPNKHSGQDNMKEYIERNNITGDC